MEYCVRRKDRRYEPPWAYKDSFILLPGVRRAHFISTDGQKRLDADFHPYTDSEQNFKLCNSPICNISATSIWN